MNVFEACMIVMALATLVGAWSTVRKNSRPAPAPAPPASMGATMGAAIGARIGEFIQRQIAAQSASARAGRAAGERAALVALIHETLEQYIAKKQKEAADERAAKAGGGSGQAGQEGADRKSGVGGDAGRPEPPHGRQSLAAQDGFGAGKELFGSLANTDSTAPGAEISGLDFVSRERVET